ncbi:MAG: hypothetical protein N2255_07620, partial [Kiritimatiellae bacterium]|nr:hypothetical protein [Kiritimatiellia bacterium]
MTALGAVTITLVATTCETWASETSERTDWPETQTTTNRNTRPDIPNRSAADRAREKTYRILQREVERVDSLFARGMNEQKKVPPSLFCFGIFGEATVDSDGKLEFEPIFDTDVEVRLPSAETRLRLLISTHDPTALREREMLDPGRPVRFGVARAWLRHFDSGIGLKLRVPPTLYAKTSWGRTWKAKSWRFYPYEKIFWESDKGLGEITSLVAGWWHEPWDLRISP